VLLQHAVAVTFQALVLGAVVTAILLVSDPLVDLDLSLANLLGTMVGVVLLGVLFGCTALVVGAIAGSKATAVGVTAALVALAYLTSTLPQLVDGLKPLRWLSPYWYATADSPIALGFTWWHAAVLVAATAAVLVVGVLAFERRDLAR
jgi:ABC-2 type transport system permease protein